MDKAGAGHRGLVSSLCLMGEIILGAIIGLRESRQEPICRARWCGLACKESTRQSPFAAAIRLFPKPARSGKACPRAAWR